MTKMTPSRRTIAIAALVVAHLSGHVGLAGTYYVNDLSFSELGSVCTAGGNDANDGLSTSTPMRHIQALLDKYPNIGTGDTLWADPGTYVENITIGSSHSGLALQGAGADVTVINGNASGSCICLDGFAGGVVTGFTIQNGSAMGGAGIACRNGSSPVIADNYITSNSNQWEWGGGIYAEEGSSPTILDNTITANFAPEGGGVYCASSTVVDNNTISGNSAGRGAGIFCAWGQPVVTGNIVSGNEASVYGGGVYCATGSDASIVNNAIRGNASVGNDGGGVYCFESGASLINNTIVGNSASTHYGGGICCWSHGENALVANCIFWGNTAASGPQVALKVFQEMTVEYCDVEGGQAGVYRDPDCVLTCGTGNLDTDPLFSDPGYWDGDTWVEGDHHLKSQAGRYDPALQDWVLDDVTSPCIDTGDPASYYFNEPEPNGDRINMGAYGNTAEASKSFVPPVGIEHGTASAGSNWTTVNLTEPFTDPIVVAGPATNGGWAQRHAYFLPGQVPGMGLPGRVALRRADTLAGG